MLQTELTVGRFDFIQIEEPALSVQQQGDKEPVTTFTAVQPSHQQEYTTALHDPVLLLMSIIEFGEEVGGPWLFCVLEVLHDVGPLLPYVDGFHKVHLALIGKKEILK